ncbi:MAG: asparaginase [Clostridiales bacterium]|nr:asparaginase [Clostridiales bacterium]
MPEILLEISRGPLTENLIRGDIAVTDAQGVLLYQAGDPFKYTYIRSASKPLQALAALERGVAARFGLSQEEIAVMCSSHNAEDFHVGAVKSILSKIGLDESCLKCGATYSYANPAVTESLMRRGLPKSPLYNNCSGKHSAMLALCVMEGYGSDDYYLPEHPVQQLILQTVAEFAGMQKEGITIGIDGCGVPVFALPLYNMAYAYARLFGKRGFGAARARAARDVRESMTGFPHMVAGTGEFCTALMTAYQGELVGKKGADGVYCVGLAGGGLGIAVKTEDGSLKWISSVVMSVLDQLGLLNTTQIAQLAKFYVQDNLNCRGEKVGQVSPVFTLHRPLAT